MSLRRCVLTVVASTLALAALPSAAAAAWSPLQRLPGTASPAGPVVATDARGDAAVGWLRTPARAGGTSALHVAVRRGPAGAFTARTLLHGRGIALTGLALSFDDRGELTVAWVQRGMIGGSATHPTAVRAAFRTAGGRWSVSRRVSIVVPFTGADPALAVRPDRTVLLAFNAGIPSAPGAAYAWRRPGHIFERAHSLRTGSRPRGELAGLKAAVDADGRAYVTGVRGCDGPRSGGVVVVAPPAATRFGAPRLVAPPPARELRFAVDPSAGGGTLTWLAESCSATELLPGRVQAVHLARSGAPGGPAQELSPAPATETTLSGGPDHTAEAGWTAIVDAAPDGLLQIARTDAAGVFGPSMAPPGGWVAVAADGAGDQLVENLRPAAGGFPDRAAVRTPDGAIELSPLRARFATAGAAVTPTGRGLAVATSRAGHIQVTTWRP